jgi:hypothetical protein
LRLATASRRDISVRFACTLLRKPALTHELRKATLAGVFGEMGKDFFAKKG